MFGQFEIKTYVRLNSLTFILSGTRYWQLMFYCIFAVNRSIFRVPIFMLVLEPKTNILVHVHMRVAHQNLLFFFAHLAYRISSFSQKTSISNMGL